MMISTVANDAHTSSTLQQLKHQIQAGLSEQLNQLLTPFSESELNLGC